MKKISFALCALLFLVACSSNDDSRGIREELLGTWTLDRYADYNLESGELVGMGTNGKTLLILNSDNTCFYHGSNGTYSISGNNINFRYNIITFSDGTQTEERKDSYRMEESSANRLTLSYEFETQLNGNLRKVKCKGYEYYVR